MTSSRSGGNVAQPQSSLGRRHVSGRPSGMAGDPPRRADAQRNRDALLAAASRAFAAPSGTVSLEAIARDAGVGIGTLYRHFPTRETLIDAIYAAELDALAASAESLSRELPADQALREWVARYARFVRAKHGMAQVLHGANDRVPTAGRERISAGVELLVGEGVRQGVLRADVEVGDVATLFLGIFLATADGDNAGQISRLLDLVLDALRPV